MCALRSDCCYKNNLYVVYLLTELISDCFDHVLLLFLLLYLLLSAVHSDKTLMGHVKQRDGLQQPGDGRLGLHERLELHERLGLHELGERSDERPLENDKHMVMNGRLRYELHAFLSPNFPHLLPIDFLVVFRRHHHLLPPQKMQATQDCTVVRVKMKNKSVKKKLIKILV